VGDGSSGKITGHPFEPANAVKRFCAIMDLSVGDGSGTLETRQVAHPVFGLHRTGCNPAWQSATSPSVTEIVVTETVTETSNSAWQSATSGLSLKLVTADLAKAEVRTLTSYYAIP
jgi:hypothetical protein